MKLFGWFRRHSCEHCWHNEPRFYPDSLPIERKCCWCGHRQFAQRMARRRIAGHGPNHYEIVTLPDDQAIWT